MGTSLNANNATRTRGLTLIYRAYIDDYDYILTMCESCNGVVLFSSPNWGFP